MAILNPVVQGTPDDLHLWHHVNQNKYPLKESEYNALSNLFHNYNAAFQSLPLCFQQQFFKELLKK